MSNAMKYIAIFIAGWLVLGQQNGRCSTENREATQRSYFGWFIGGGMIQSDFEEIRQEPYFLGYPGNFSTQFNGTIYLGNPDKFFVSVPFGLIVSRENSGNYLNYKTRTGRGGSFLNVQAGYQLFRNNERRVFKAVYVLAGISQSNYLVYSRASGSGVINPDTSFYFEYSRVKTLFVSPEIMIELLNMKKSDDGFPSYPLTLKFGYNAQFRNPSWTILESSSQVPLRNGNMNGFYFSLGFNFWLKKGNDATK